LPEIQTRRTPAGCPASVAADLDGQVSDAVPWFLIPVSAGLRRVAEKNSSSVEWKYPGSYLDITPVIQFKGHPEYFAGRGPVDTYRNTRLSDGFEEAKGSNAGDKGLFHGAPLIVSSVSEQAWRVCAKSSAEWENETKAASKAEGAK